MPISTWNHLINQLGHFVTLPLPVCIYQIKYISVKFAALAVINFLSMKRYNVTLIITNYLKCYWLRSPIVYQVMYQWIADSVTELSNFFFIVVHSITYVVGLKHHYETSISLTVTTLCLTCTHIYMESKPQKQCKCFNKNQLFTHSQLILRLCKNLQVLSAALPMLYTKRYKLQSMTTFIPIDRELTENAQSHLSWYVKH